jgi:hypothetical protein
MLLETNLQILAKEPINRIACDWILLLRINAKGDFSSLVFQAGRKLAKQ